MSRWIASAVSAFVLGIALAAGLAVMTIASPDAQSTGTWQVVGSLVEVRSGATATPLGDGRVLVAGGQNASGLLATAEIVDATGSSSATSSLSIARSGHTATALADGRVLVTGGIAAGAPTPEGAPGPLTATASAEIFDPSTNAWTPLLMNLARAHHTATRATDGLVVIAGGDVDGVASQLVEIFNPADNTFSLAGGALSALRTRHAAAALPNNRVLVAGGTNGTDVLASTDIVNATTGAVVAGPSLQSARMNFTATDLLNGDVLVAGGTDRMDGTNELATAERYIGSLGAFGPAPGLSGPRQGHSAVRLPNNAGVIVVGGTASGVTLKQTELFLPASGIFQLQGDQNIEHLDGLTAATGAEGVAIGAGGAGTAAVEGYRFATVKTDKDDYAPGTRVYITGSGWAPGTVTMILHELQELHGDLVLTAEVGEDGTFTNSEFVPEEHHVGVRFYLTATQGSLEAQHTFTDARNLDLTIVGSGTVKMTPSVGTVNAPTACGGTNSDQPSQTVSSTCAPNISFSNNTPTVTFEATPALGFVFAGWSAQANLSSSSCSGTTTPCTATLGSNPALTATFTAAPSVTINQAAAQADPTNTSPINFTVVFSTTVTDFATGDVTLSGTAGATTATVTGSGATYNVAVSGMTSSGTVIATIAAGVASGNQASTSTDNTVTYDNTAPTVTINQAAGQVDPTNTSPINFTVVFSESVTDFATGDVTLGGTAGATTATVTGSGTTYNVAVTGMTSNGTVIASIAAAVAHDAANNANAASTSTDNTVTYDNTAPTVTINQAVGQADPTNTSPINFTVVFSESVADFATGDVSLSGTSGATTATVTGSGTTYNVAVSGMTGDGTVIASIGAGVAHDAANNANTASTSTDNTVTYDATAPTVTINQAAAQVDPTNASPINFSVVFSESVADFATGDVTLSGTAGATTATVTGTGTTYNVAVTGMAGDGTVIASIAAGVAHDAANNANTASTSTDNTVTYDTTPPTVTINQAVGQADPTNASPINFTVVFSEPVADFATGDVTLAGTAGATTATVTGTGTTYNVAVTGMTADGTVIASVAAGVAHDAATNANTGSTSTDNTVTRDTTPPTVTINQAVGQADPTNGSPINFTVVFSEPVADFATGDVTLSGTAGATTGTVTGSGTTYNVAVSGMASDGTVIASIAAGAAHDAATNANTVSSSTDNTVTYDNTPPTVTINQAAGQADPTNTSPINFTVIFSEPVADFATGDVALSGTAGATTGTVTGSGTTYNVAVTGMAGDGTVIASIAAGVAHDAATNANLASTSTDNTVTYDATPPTVTINQAAGQSDPTNASPINFTVVFSEPVADFATGDVALSGTAGATTAVVTGTGTTYNVAVSGMTTDGTVIATIAAGVAHDAATNANLGSTSSDNTVTYDTTPPTVTINQAVGQADPTNASPINFTVVFSESVADFATGDVTLSGGAGATTATVTGSGTTYNVAVTGMTSDGTVIATIAAGVAHDAAANANLTSSSVDNTVTYDTTPPTVTINQAVGQADPTNASPIHFTVVFSEPVTDFATGDVTLGGTAGATTATVTGSGTTYNVAVTGMGDGTVIASVAAGVAHDAATNANMASTSSDDTVTFDGTPPTVTINQALTQVDPTNASPIHFTVVFSEPVADFATGDVTLSGTAGATTAAVSGSGTTYDVVVSGMTGDGTVIATIAAGVAHDAATNANLGSTSTDNTVTYDTTAPTVTINQAVGQADPTNAATINFTAVFSESVADFATGDVTLGGTAGATTAVVTGSGTTYNVAVSGMTSDGTVVATIAAGVAHDAATNANTGSTSTDNSVTYDNTPPTVTINQAAGQVDSTSGSPINFTVVFSESVADFATGDVTLGGTAGATTATVTGSGTTYNVAVSGMTSDGTVTATIAAGVAHDAATNANSASSSTDNTVTYDTSTMTAVTSSVNPSVYGQPVTFTATVTPNSPGGGTPTGTVQFVIDGVNAGGPVTLSVTGTATYMTSALTVTGSPHSVTANYLGDAIFNASNGSLSGGQTVNQATTTLTITEDNPDPSVVNENVVVKWTLSVNSPGGGTPVGNITVSGADTAGCTAAISAGQCTLTFSVFGAKTLTANYAGDANYVSSSDTEGHTVNRRHTSTGVVASPASIVLGASSMITVTVTDDDPAGTKAYPTGTVSLTSTIASDTFSPCVLSNFAPGVSKCTSTVTPTVAGPRTITANFSATSVHAASSGTTSLTTVFGVCVLYDQTKSHKQGSTIPVKLFLCNASGQNVSSSSTVVMATGIVKADASASGATEDSGSANPDFNFRWDSSLQPNGGGYIYNLSTKPAIYSTGTWNMTFTVNGVASPGYVVHFDIK